MHESTVSVLTHASASNLKPLKTQHMCAIAAIDGDGYPFSPSFIRQGRAGGQEAATALKAKLMSDIGLEVQLMIFVYLNRVGMVEALISNGIIHRRSDLDDFVTGFNQASPLFHMIDVGHGKEAADAKIRGFFPRFLVVER